MFENSLLNQISNTIDLLRLRAKLDEFIFLTETSLADKPETVSQLCKFAAEDM